MYPVSWPDYLFRILYRTECIRPGTALRVNRIIACALGRELWWG